MLSNEEEVLPREYPILPSPNRVTFATDRIPAANYLAGGNNVDHFHDTDRARANHTGTQILTTISDVTITFTNLNILDDGVNTTLHFHDSDRARANHTGTQTMATISDLPTLASGVWTPTLTNGVNVAASTSYEGQYIRVGAVVTVSGKVDIDPTAGALTATEIGISLPVASNIGATEDLAGTGSTAAQETAAILGDVANNRASLNFTAITSTNNSWYYHFTYQII